MFNDMAFGLYVAEQEGWLDTHESKVNKFIKELATAANPTDTNEQNDILYRCGLTENSLSDYDKARIQDAIDKLIY